MQIVIRPAAAADIEDAFVWYEQQRRGLGSEFLKIVDDTLIAIQRAPQLHPVIHRNNNAVESDARQEQSRAPHRGR